MLDLVSQTDHCFFALSVLQTVVNVSSKLRRQEGGTTTT